MEESKRFSKGDLLTYFGDTKPRFVFLYNYPHFSVLYRIDTRKIVHFANIERLKTCE